MEEGKKNRNPKSSLTASFVTGAIALVFLVIGYQVALFVHRAAVLRLAADRDRPDTVYVVDRALAEEILGEKTPPVSTVRKPAARKPEVVSVREKAAPRKVESFPFDPNTVSGEDLQRLGFSEKQAASILHYREKGGRFRRKADFAKSYVVADSVYDRLEPFIRIPRIDLNRADSTALLALPGVGPYYAGKIVAYREALGGFSRPEQLMDLYRFDQDKFDGLKDLVTCSEAAPYPLWELPEEELARHPYISRAEAHSIVLYRTHQPRGAWTLEGLQKAGTLSPDHARQLASIRIATP